MPTTKRASCKFFNMTFTVTNLMASIRVKLRDNWLLTVSIEAGTLIRAAPCNLVGRQCTEVHMDPAIMIIFSAYVRHLPHILLLEAFSSHQCPISPSLYKPFPASLFEVLVQRPASLKMGLRWVAFSSLALFLLALSSTPMVTQAATKIVGGSQGWRFGFNYTDWAFKNAPFYINDTLSESLHSTFFLLFWSQLIKSSACKNKKKNFVILCHKITWILSFYVTPISLFQLFQSLIY